ncbi:unnamed protein product [Discosporangium mesarthrocarpum]
MSGGVDLFDYIFEEDVEGAREYVSQGGRVHVADTLGTPSLVLAAGTGNVELMKILTCAEDAEIDFPSFHGGETPLIIASSQGHLSVVKHLLQRGADVNATDHRGDTALSTAYFFGKVEVVKALLAQAGIDTEIRNIQGKRVGDDLDDHLRDCSQDEELNLILKDFRSLRGIPW